MIDRGINESTDGEDNSKIVGDEEIDAVKEVVSWITPVPRDVGFVIAPYSGSMLSLLKIVR